MRPLCDGRIAGIRRSLDKDLEDREEGDRQRWLVPRAIRNVSVMRDLGEGW